MHHRSPIGVEQLALSFNVRTIGETVAEDMRYFFPGSLTLHVAQWVRVEKIRRISPGAFRPPPKVESMVIRLIPRETPAVEVPDEGLLERIVRLGFGQRRKMLRNTLSGKNGWDREVLERAAAKAGVDLSARAEALAIDDYGRLCRALFSADGKVA